MELLVFPDDIPCSAHQSNVDARRLFLHALGHGAARTPLCSPARSRHSFACYATTDSCLQAAKKVETEAL